MLFPDLAGDRLQLRGTEAMQLVRVGQLTEMHSNRALCE